MNILVLAPHPFFQTRGTPIATRALLSALSSRGELVDVVTYHEGELVQHSGVAFYRIPAPPFVHDIRPGFSIKKLVCDVLVFFKAVSLCCRKRYDLVHCMEESVFIGMALKGIFGTPYLYDMDSVLSQQLVNRTPALRVVAPLLQLCERLAVRGAMVIVPMCEQVGRAVASYGPKKIIVLRDTSVLSNTEVLVRNGLRRTLKINGPVAMYVGNLESYQGIDLLLEGFTFTLRETPQAVLLVIGGLESQIKHYRGMAHDLEIAGSVHFLGPRPVEQLGNYLAEADVLVSPRIKGVNTPLKIFSYLDSGKPVLATNLSSHTQVLIPEVSVLCEPQPEAFGRSLGRLLQDKALRERLGKAGRALVKKRHSRRAFHDTVQELYDYCSASIKGRG